jgi:hypothetical protein
MDEVKNEKTLLCLVQSAFHARGIIGVDGRDEVGKTTLANTLATATRGSILSLDDFIVKNQGNYVSALQKTELKTALGIQQRPVIVEGVCLLAALATVSVKPDLLIYIKRLRFGWYWHDEEILDTEENVDTLIRRHSPITPLKEEIIRYHFQHRLSHQADIIYLQTAIK